MASRFKKNFFKDADKWIKENAVQNEEIKRLGYAKTAISKLHPTLF